MSNELEDLKYAFYYISTIVARFGYWDDCEAMRKAYPHLMLAMKEIAVPLAQEYVSRESSFISAEGKNENR